MSTRYGYWLRILHWCTDQAVSESLETMELTAAQGHLMAYLNHREEPPCPRDVEEDFRLSHPTVSGLLQRLEQKGFLELRADEQDRRKKRIYVLPKGRACHELMHKTIQENEKKLVQGFTPQEQAQFADYLRRSIANMGGNPQESKEVTKP